MSLLRIEERNGGKYIVDVNPATLEVLDYVRLETEDEVKEKVLKAQRAFKWWSNVDFDTRADYLKKVADIILDEMDDIATIITREMGKPKMEALTADIMVPIQLIAIYTKRGKKLIGEYEIPMEIFKFVKRSKIAPRPYGVVAVISPWNYPFAIPMSGIIFALLAGNTVVFKPASDVALIGRKIQEIFDKAGLPEGVMNTVICPGAVAEKVLCAPPVMKVVFTGSTEIGTRIIKKCAENIIPVVAELGGKDPMVVFEDADLESASSGAVWGAFTNAGQVCASVERLYVHKKIADKFIEMVVEKTKKIRVGNGENWDVDMGPLVNEGQLKIVEEHVNDAIKNGARVLVGGKRAEMAGYFYYPTVLIDVNHSMRCIQEETFGPTLPIMTFETEDEAVELANDTKYGLTASVWTQDLKRADRVAKKIFAGSVLVNDHAMSYGLVETPWQGAKQSGIGVSHSDEGFKEFLYLQHINFDHMPIKRKPWWYPYSQEAYNLFKSVQRILFKKGAKNKFEEIVKIMKEFDKIKNLF